MSTPELPRISSIWITLVCYGPPVAALASFVLLVFTAANVMGVV